MADFKAALKGAADGAGAGEAFGGGNPDVVLAGAATAALIFGAEASYTKAQEEEEDPKAEGSRFWNSSTAGPNTGNSYDYIGFWHYNTLYKSGDEPGPLTPSQFLNFAKDLTIDSNVFDSTDFTYFNFDSLYFALDSLIVQFDTFGMPAFVDYMHSNSEISSDIHAYLELYYDTYVTLIPSSVSSFVAYSITMEGYVTADETLSAIDKQILLMVMATTRYGIQYADV